MLLLRLWNYLRGYVIIYVEGYFLEKFINVCIHRQIYLWDVKRQKDYSLKLKVSIKGFKMLRPVATKTKCRVRIFKKRGFPFVLSRYKRRKTFAIGAVVFILLFYTMSSFIWSIEVTGNKELDTKLITEQLASIGITPGVLKYNIDAKKVANDMMTQMDELSWIGITLKGTKVKVEIVERIKAPKIVPVNIPCNIVASKDGLVNSIITKAGQDIVKSGDTVKKGQVLISGTVTSKTEGVQPRLVHAMGNIEARTWYEGNCIVSTKISETEPTGQTKKNYTLVLFAKKINLFHGKVNFVDYDKIEEDKKLSIGKDMVLPFGIIIDKYVENKIVEREVSLDEAKRLASDKAYEEASGDIPENAKIIKTSTDFIQRENGELVANVIIECVEEIGIMEKIGGN